MNISQHLPASHRAELVRSPTPAADLPWGSVSHPAVSPVVPCRWERQPCEAQGTARPPACPRAWSPPALPGPSDWSCWGDWDLAACSWWLEGVADPQVHCLTLPVGDKCFPVSHRTRYMYSPAQNCLGRILSLLSLISFHLPPCESLFFLHRQLRGAHVPLSVQSHLGSSLHERCSKNSCAVVLIYRLQLENPVCDTCSR